MTDRATDDPARPSRRPSPAWRAATGRGRVGMTTHELALELGRQLRALRLFHDISQEQLASLASVSVGTVANLENGKGGSLGTLIKVLRPLDRVDWLFQLDNVSSRGPSPLQIAAQERRNARIRQRARRRSS